MLDIINFVTNELQLVLTLFSRVSQNTKAPKNIRMTKQIAIKESKMKDTGSHDLRLSCMAGEKKKLVMESHNPTTAEEFLNHSQNVYERPHTN